MPPISTTPQRPTPKKPYDRSSESPSTALILTPTPTTKSRSKDHTSIDPRIIKSDPDYLHNETHDQDMLDPSPSPSPSVDNSEEEFKPSISDGEDDTYADIWDSKGSKSKKKTGGTPRKGVKQAGNGNTPKKKTEGSSTPKKGVNGGRGIPYTGEDDWLLFQEMRPRVGTPNWAAIAQKLGRDSKSCQNRWSILQKKLEGAIKQISS